METEKIKDLYDRYAFIIYKRCRTILNNTQDAEDAMHEVFLKFIGQYEKLKDTEYCIPWIFKTAQNHCFNLIRDNKKFIAPGALDAIRDPESFEERLEHGQLLRLLFSLGSAPVRAAAYYTYAEGLTQSEIEKITGQSSATIRRNLKKFEEHVAKAKQRMGL